MLYFGIGKYISANLRKGFWSAVDGQPIWADAFTEIDDSNFNLALASAKSSATSNLAIAIAKMKVPKWHPSVPILTCKDMNKSFVDYVIRDYTKPMSVATYKTANEMPENLRKALPPVEDLRRILDADTGNNTNA